jgi:hypothetical protein
VKASSPLVGSSRMRTDGRVTRVHPMLSRLCQQEGLGQVGLKETTRLTLH